MSTCVRLLVCWLLILSGGTISDTEALYLPAASNHQQHRSGLLRTNLGHAADADSRRVLSTVSYRHQHS